MQTAEMIPAEEFCLHHHIELSFISSLHESGLIDLTKEDERLFVYSNQLDVLERLVRLHEELDINLEGIETVTYLLKRMNDMQQQIVSLSNRLRYFEEE